MDCVAISILDGEFDGLLPLLHRSEELYDRIGPYSNDTWESCQLVNVMMAGQDLSTSEDRRIEFFENLDVTLGDFFVALDLEMGGLDNTVSQNW